MAGGGGTRLWPRSRDETPKQFLKLFGGETLVEITAKRLNKFIDWENIFVSTNVRYKDQIADLLPQIPAKNIIVEPARRDTAPAHGLGAAYIYSKDKDAVIVNAASDHFITPQKNYKHTMLAAAESAFSGDWLVAVGIRPTYPHVGYGYIKRGERIKTVGGRYVYKLDKFVEKPDLKKAKGYVSTGDYFWNANHYVWRADTYLKALEKHAPKISSGLMKIMDSIGSNDEDRVLSEEFEKMPKISVDYAVSEKADNSLMLVADYSWTDIGDWNEVWKNLPHDGNGNAIIDGDEVGGEIINIDTSDALIHRNGRMIAVIDVDNVVIVDTKDALLICSKSKAQNVKKIVNQLKDEGRTSLL